MTDTRPPIAFLCNGASLPDGLSVDQSHHLEYRKMGKTETNVNLRLPDFVRDVAYLPPRYLDLLELAAYVFSADRLVSRGTPDSLEYHSWSRNQRMIIKVRDISFWRRADVKSALSKALAYVSGDADYSFTFLGGHKTPPTSLFDRETTSLPLSSNAAVILFSGGLDSLAGALEILKQGKDSVCLVSHQSQPSMKRTQGQLVQAMAKRFPGRIHHYRYRCSLRGERAIDENQRTRSFLYCSIAAAVAKALSTRQLSIYENGVTALNFPKRQDMLNARASRTTHPKTIELFARFFSLVEERPVTIHTPFEWKTKTDVIRYLKELGGIDLLTSAVSCSRTFQRLDQATHCGVCSQCIDRRFAAYAAGLDEVDTCGLYADDFVQGPIRDGMTRTALIDYVRQARDFATSNVDKFAADHMLELVDARERFEHMDELTMIEAIWELCQRHGDQVLAAIRRMRELHDDPFSGTPQGTLLHIVSEREYLREPVERLAADIGQRLSKAIPRAFRRTRPKDEPDLNEKIAAILSASDAELQQEHPYISFACGHAVPDHSTPRHDLFIETKYVRKGTTPSKASDGMAADLTKYGHAFVLFIVYDPEGRIAKCEEFKSDFEKGGNCAVCIIR